MSFTKLLNIEKVTVLTHLRTTDEVQIDLNAETPFPNLGYKPTLKIETKPGFGVEWAKRLFPNETIEEVNIQTGERTVHLNRKDT